MIICVSNSEALERAIYKNCLNSFLFFLATPSAILEGIDTTAQRSCEIIQQVSYLGKFIVSR